MNNSSIHQLQLYNSEILTVSDIIENVLLLLWSHLFQFLATKQAPESVIAMHLISPSGNKKRDGTINFAMTDEQRRELQSQAITVLINQHNILEKLEKLPEVCIFHDGANIMLDS